ncbi:MAG: DEAD/DEAH box helicase, partial [Phycisphaerales bacterium]
VICPTRELAQQVAEVADMALRGTRHSAVCAYGKVSIGPQLSAIREGCDMIVGTPGRLRELIEEHGISLAHVRSVAIDEVDRMLDMGFLPQVTRILDRLSPERTSGVFTATMPKAVKQLTEQFLRRPILCEAGRHTHAADHVAQHLIEVANHDKVDLLLQLFKLGHGKGTLVFCGTRRRVGWVATALERNGLRAGMLHGDRSQARRDAALGAFRAGELDVLVCTDVAARGLHVDRVRTVINYDVPNGVEEFVHRVGRAGHGGGTGEAFTFLCRRDAEKWDRIEWNVVDPVPLMDVPGWSPSEPRRRSEDPRESQARPGSPRDGDRRGSDRRGGGGGASGGGPRRGSGGGGGRGRSEHPARRRDAEGGTGSRGGRPGGKPASRRATRAIPKDQKPGGGVRRPKPPASD